jgi:thiosulfate/3-mercaptopyruvate sulfurtransferase
VSSFGPLVSTQWLAAHIADRELVVVDMRWYLGRPGEGLRAYSAGHIPGAVFCDVDGAINGRSGRGRHPLPEREQFQAAMRELGVCRGDRVVAYDDVGGSIAARMWFLLRYFGHEAVAVLDGGLQAWQGDLEPGAATRAAGDFIAGEPHREWVLSFEDVRTLPPGRVLLDARARERYTGAVEPTGVRAGHIPGARSAPWAGNLDSENRFRAPEELRRRYLQLGADGRNSVAYCGSGVTATHHLLALELAGLPGGRLYEGSWSEWAVRPDAEVATGDDPLGSVQ